MAWPFFALAKKAWMQPLTYKKGDISIEIGPGTKRGGHDLRQGNPALYRQPNGFPR